MIGLKQREVISRFWKGSFQGSDSSFSKGLFDSEANIVRSFFTCKFFADYFAKNTVFSVVFLRLLLIANN